MVEEPPSHPLGEAEKEALRFLERDFNQCFQQMRYYDDQILGVFRFLLTFYTGLVGVALALYQFGLKENVDFGFAAVLSLLIGLILGLSLFAQSIRNRVYFVQVARYINEQRRLFFRYRPLGFENASRMYTNPKQPPYFNWRSSQTTLEFVIALLNAVIFGLLVYIQSANVTGSYNSGYAVFSAIILLGLQVGYAVTYLLTREGKSASKAVFGKD